MAIQSVNELVNYLQNREYSILSGAEKSILIAARKATTFRAIADRETAKAQPTEKSNKALQEIEDKAEVSEKALQLLAQEYIERQNATVVAKETIKQPENQEVPEKNDSNYVKQTEVPQKQPENQEVPEKNNSNYVKQTEVPQKQPENQEVPENNTVVEKLATTQKTELQEEKTESKQVTINNRLRLIGARRAYC